MIRTLALVAALGIAAQDDGKKPSPEDARKKLEALRADLKKALADTAAKGSFEFSGSASDDDGVSGFAGDLSGKVSAPFAASVRGAQGRDVYEVFHQNGHTVERLTRRGPAFNPAQTADEVLSLLDLAKLAEFAAKAPKASTEPDAKIGGVDCRVIKATLAGEAIRRYVETDEDADADEAMGNGGVELTLYVGKQDGLVRKIGAVVAKDEGGEEDADEDAPKISVTYALTLSSHGSAKVDFPEDVKKALEK